MKSSTFIPSVAMAAVLALVLAACQHEGKKDKTVQSKAAQAVQSGGHPAQPEPGAQQGPGAQPVQQNQQGGPATALGLPGASAALASGEANLKAGEQLTIQGGANNVMACGGCHGAQGEGNAAAGLPRIAGQPRAYLARQLGAYANDARVNPVMQPIAKAMNAQQIRDVSAYYASLEGAPGATSAAPAGAKPSDAGGARGRLLSEVGDQSRGVQACANCHGPGGRGKQPDYPYLAGQHANYLTAAMGAWKSGARKTDGSGQMPQIARALADADVAALSSYFAAQPAPPSAAGSTVRGPGAQGKQPQQQTPAPVRR